jgi:hypothetical protein
MLCGYLCILLFLHLSSWLCIEYITLLVVGKELQQIANELIEEFKELTKLPSINFAIQKSKELYAKVSGNLLDCMICAVCSCFWIEVYDRCKNVCKDFTVHNSSLCTTAPVFRTNQFHCGFFHTSDEDRLHEHEVYHVHTIVWSQSKATHYFAINHNNAKTFK